MSDKRFQKTCQWMRTAFRCALLLLPARLECAELKYIDYEIFAGNANLPSPWVKQIFQDKRGFVWIATNNNLVRYDSQRFTTFAPNPDKAGSVTTSKPLSIQSDSEDNIWISSPEALSRFDEGTETFENFTLRDTTGKRLLQNSQALILASNDHLVIGSLHGLLIFDPTRKTWTGKYTNIGGESTRVRSIVETHPGEFLLGTSTGIWRFNLETEQFSRQVYLNNQGQDVGKFGIMHILVDREERLWICADSDRLYCFSQDGAELDLTIEGVPSNQSSFTDFSSVFQHRDGNIWAAPEQSGLIALAPGSLDFQQMESNPSNKQSDKPLVSAIYELSDGTLCFGTRNSGVTMLNPKRLPIDYYSAETTPTQLAIQNVRRLTSDMNNSIWLSGSTGQLQRFDLETRAFFKTSPTTGDSKLLNGQSFRSITSDDQGNLFILLDRKVLFYDATTGVLEDLTIDWKALGTRSTDFPETLYYDALGILWLIGGKVYQHNPKTSESVEAASPPMFPDGRFRGLSVAELANGDMWIGTRLRGLHLYERESNTIKRSFTERSYPALMNQRLVFDLSVDEFGNVWAASSLGLIKFNEKLTEVDYFPDIEGVGNSSVNGLKFDPTGNLWLTSTRGLYRLNPEIRQARLYSSSQGITQQTFSNKALAISDKGILAIGSLRGLSIIDTLDMPDEQAPRIPAITSILTSFKREPSIEVNRKNIPLQSPKGDFRLEHSNNNIAFKFTNFNYTNDPNTNLLYKIDGLIEQWTSIGQTNELAFPSLPPGNFTFRIRAENGDLSSDESAIHFTILPPFWKTKLFVFVLSLLVVGIIFIFIRRRTHIIRTANKKLETLVAERTLELERSKEEALKARDEAERANLAKSDFLANISHEIRTPMNGIIGMNHMLIEANLEPELNQYARTVGRNAESMLALINDILDLSKIEAGKIILENEPFNIQTTIEDAIDLFAFEAHEKGVALKSLPDTDLPTLAIGDSLRVKQVVMNLVSNAIKFTSSGSVSIYLSLVSETADATVLECRVKDTGIGIPRKAWPTLFDAFTQADSSTARKYGGSGLGLSITRNLVKAMNGEIRFESLEGKGTTFTITFTLRKVDPRDIISPIDEPESSLVGETLIAFPDIEIEEWLEAWLKKYAIPVHIADHPAKIIDGLRNGVSNLLIDKQWVDQSVSEEIRKSRSRSSTRVILFQSVTEGYKDPGFDYGIIDSYENYPIRPVNIVNRLQQRSQTNARLEYSPPDGLSYPNSGPNILIVDDNKMNQEVLKALLSKNGSQVQEAFNGREAVKMSSNSHYDLIFMDCMMPEMDGYQATQIIRKNPKNPNTNTPIIALTANDLKEDRTKCLEAGMDDYLIKPILPSNLSTILATWIANEMIQMPRRQTKAARQPRSKH